MDTSKEYIKMCYKAKEIQDRDFTYFMTHPKEYVGEYPSELGNVMTWLPRQDQLQEIISNRPFEHDTYKMLKSFTAFCGELPAHPINYAKSMEQLWLAFVMKEKFNKQWTGDNWKE